MEVVSLNARLEKKLEETNAELYLRNKELEQSQKRFTEIADHSEVWIWETDARGLYTYASPVSEKIFGYKPDEIVGKKYFYDLFAPETREELKRSALEIFARKESFRNFANPNVRKDGGTVIIETSGTPILNEQGQLLGYRGSDINVTERRLAEKERRTSETKLREQVEELEKLNRFMVGREMDILELKKEVNQLLKAAGQPEKYRI